MYFVDDLYVIILQIKALQNKITLCEESGAPICSACLPSCGIQ